MFSTGLNGGFALGTWPGTQGTSAQASPQASSVPTAGFGTTASNDTGGSDPVTTAVLVTGTAALVGLALIWYSLPR